MLIPMRRLEELSIHDPDAALTAIARALDGRASYLPVPADDPARASILRNTMAVGEEIAADVALVLATSGSTGVPKGAMLTADNLISSAEATHTALGGPGAWTLALPAHHVAGIQVLVRSLVAGEAPRIVDVAGGFEPARLAEVDLDADRLYTALVPMQVRKCLSTLAGIEALRLYDAILVGGAPLDADTRTSAAELGINLVSTYGASETSGGCVYDGRPLPGVTVQLQGEEGRIVLGGPTIARGYRNFPDHPAFAQPGFFRTEDAGAIVDGRLMVQGRLDDVIISGGLKLHPKVLETEILAVRGVEQVTVVGLEDARLGQLIAAAYVGRPEPMEIITALEHLPRWQLPRKLIKVAQLPTTALGKPDLPATRRLFT